MGPPDPKGTKIVLGRGWPAPQMRQTFDADGNVAFSTVTPDHTIIARKGTWRLVGSNIEITYGKMDGDTSNPTWVGAAQGLSMVFTSPLQLEEGGRMLKAVSPALPDGNATSGKIVWMRLWH